MRVNQSIKINSLMKILRHLDNGTRLTAAFLADSLGVSERTVYRYMIALQHAGYPIYFNREEMSYRFAEGFTLKKHADQSEIYQMLDLKSRMLGSSPVGLLSFDVSGHCIVANRAALAILGATEEQALCQNYHDLDSWKSSGMLVMARSVMETGVEQCADFHLLTSFCRDIWINATMSRITREGKHLLLLVMLDFTERKRIEQALRESEEISRLFLEFSPVYAFIKDDEFRFVQVSRNHEELLGKPVEQIIGKTMPELFPGEFAEKTMNDDRTVLDTGQKCETLDEFNGTQFTTIKFTFERGGRRYLAGYAFAERDRE